MLLVLTLISLSGINTAVMQEKMASNAQSKNRTFHTADSAVGELVRVLEDGNISSLEQAMSREGPNPTDGFSNLFPFTFGDTNISATYQVEYLGEVAVTSGTSMDADESTTLLKGQRFELQGVAANDNTGAVTRIYRGAEYH
jgi:type IV pilus assembly protein PilX